MTESCDNNKQFKDTIRNTVNQQLEMWITSMEDGIRGVSVWSDYEHSDFATIDFITSLKFSLERRNPAEEDTQAIERDKKWLVTYITMDLPECELTKEIKCPTINHARILFYRKHEKCKIMSICEIG